MTAEGAERRLASAVVHQAVIDYIKGRRVLDKRPDAVAMRLVNRAREFILSEEFNRIFLPEWAESGQQMLDVLEERYKTVKLKTPRIPTPHDRYSHLKEKEKQLAREAACPGHQYRPHDGRIYDGICTLCGAKRRKKREEMPYAW